MFTLKTNRLELIPLSSAQLQRYLDSPDQLEQELNLHISRDVVTERVRRAIRMKIEKMAAADEKRFAWHTYWLIVIAESSFGAGLAGFKGLPDERGQVEIGYGIDPSCQGQGYITEAARALIRWAFEESACLSVVARDTKKWNTASLRVLTKVGMTVYEESEDAFCLRVERSAFALRGS